MKIINIIIYLSWLMLLAAAIYDIFHQPIRIIIWIGALILLMLIYFKSKKFPVQYNLLISAIAILNLLGELIFEFFYKVSFYDKLLHFIVPALLFPLVYYFVKKRITDKKMLILFCICAVLALAVLWEIFEFGIDANSNLLMQGVYLKQGEGFFWLEERLQLQDKNVDTMYDLIFNLLGSLAAGFVYSIYKKKRKKSKN